MVLSMPTTTKLAVVTNTAASVCVGLLLILIGVGIGKDQALSDLAIKCLPQPGEKRLLSVVQTAKPEPSIVCVFEYAPPAAVKVKRRAT